MAFGDSPVDKDLKAAWADFCDQLKSAGDRVFKDFNPATPLQRVDGFRYLTQNLSQAFDLALETKDTKYPMVHTFCSPTRKLGSDNADCVYMQAWIDGESVYKISGNKGTARMFNITVQGPRSNSAYGFATSRPLHEPFGDTPEANIFGHELKTNWDGSFELYIGGERQGQNWLPTTKGSRKLYMRQYFDGWSEEAAEYRIERVGMDAPRPVPTPAEMIDAIRWAGQFCYDAVDFWPDYLWSWTEANHQIDPNAANRFVGAAAPAQAALPPAAETRDGRRGRQVAQMRWELKDDEALILSFDSYDGFWMATNEGVFGNSMDYLYRSVSFTPSRAAVDKDGKVRLIISRQDPGFANWIDNQGYNVGVLTFRSVMSDHMPAIETRVVRQSDVAGHMPSDSKRCSPEERVEEMHRRFDAIRRRFRI